MSAVALAQAVSRPKLAPRTSYLLIAAVVGTPLIGLDGGGFVYWNSLSQAVMSAGVLTAFAASILMLWHRGERARGVLEAGAAYAAAALLAITCCGLGWTSLWWAGIGSAAGLASVRLLLPRSGSRQRTALHMARVDQTAHRDHVLALQHAKTKAALVSCAGSLLPKYDGVWLEPGGRRPS